MKALAAVFWVLAVLVVVLFATLSWAPTRAHLAQQRHVLEEAEGQQAMLQESIQELPTMLEVQRQNEAKLGPWAAVLKDPTATGAEELQASVRPPITCQEVTPSEGSLLTCTVEGPQGALLTWLRSVVEHPRGFRLESLQLAGPPRRWQGKVTFRVATPNT